MRRKLEPGERFGAYRLDGLIGRGGMGVVYRAEHVHLGRTVALKLLAPELGENEDFRARFLRESRIAAALDHPSVVTVYDAGDIDGILYIAMRYVRGTDLAAVLKGRAPLAPNQALAIVEQVASALDAAHENGLVHRDVKPANVLIEGERCYLTDFGLTKQTTGPATALTRAGQYLGTPDYMSPEQAEGSDVDGRTDVYALGCVLYECLTGARPYPRDSDVAVLYAHLREPPPRATEVRPELPRAIDAVIATAMAKDRDVRYATCGRLLAAARTALSRPSTTTPRPTAVAEPPPTAAPERAVAAPAPAEPSAPPARLRVHRRRRVPLPLLVAGAIGIAAAVAVVVAVSGGGSKKGRGSQPHVVGSPIPVGKRPFGVVVGKGVEWVANASDGTVTRVGSNGGLRTDIRVGAGPFGLARNSRSVWVANSVSGTVTKIDVRTGAAGSPVRVGRNPYFLAADENSVFVSNGGDNTVTVLDARRGRPIGPPIPVGHSPRGIASSGTAVWVANRDDGTVSRIVNARVIKTIKVGRHPAGVAFGDDAIWVANKDSNTVSRIDLSGAGTRVTTTKVGRKPFGIAFGAGFAWVTNSRDDTVMRLDPVTAKPVGDPIRVPGQPVGVTVGEGFVWVTSNDASTLTRIEP